MMHAILKEQGRGGGGKKSRVSPLWLLCVSNACLCLRSETERKGKEKEKGKKEKDPHSHRQPWSVQARGFSDLSRDTRREEGKENHPSTIFGVSLTAKTGKKRNTQDNKEERGKKKKKPGDMRSAL